MILIVCGGRNFSDVKAVWNALDAIHRKRPITLLIEGGATGADNIAGAWADERKIPHRKVEADWNKHGKAAGPIRNREMLALGVDGVIAFPGGKGTADMKRAAREAGVTVWEPDVAIGMRDGLYRVVTSYMVAGFEVRNGRLAAVAPILRKKIREWKAMAERIGD